MQSVGTFRFRTNRGMGCWFAQFALTVLVVHATQLPWHTLMDNDGASVSNPELWPTPQQATYSCALPAVPDSCRLPRPASPAWLGWMHHRSMGSRPIPNCCRGEFLLTIPQVAWTVSKEAGGQSSVAVVANSSALWHHFVCPPTACLLAHRVPAHSRCLCSLTATVISSCACFSPYLCFLTARLVS